MSTPFIRLPIKLRNPDGSTLDAFGWGDQHYARFETPTGFSVVRDPQSGFYHYAQLSETGRFAPTRYRVEPGRGVPEGLTPHLRERAQAVREARSAAEAPLGRQRWRERRAQRRTAVQRAAAIQAAPPPQGTTGDYTGLCLLVQFPDVPATVTSQEVTDFCNCEGYTAFGNNGSVYDYFLHNSLGRLRYRNVVTGYYTAQQPRSYYTDPSIQYGQRAQELIREALDSLCSTGFDFSGLSRDAEGYIYALNVLYAGGRDNAWAQGLWPHSSGLWPNYELGGGAKLRDYQITNTGDQLTLRTFCHENGHMLCDFPDLYDYGYESVGDGMYCLMAYGGADTNPVEVCAYLKRSAGWASQELVVTPGLHAKLSAKRNDFVIHRNPGVPTEYYIVENRQQTGRDASLPAAGLAIWHIDELGSNDYQDMSPTQHYECALVQADGRCDLEQGMNYGDSTDLFAAPACTRFSDQTTPAARWWDGSPSGLNLCEISEVGSSMSVTQMGPVVWRNWDVGQGSGAVGWQIGDINGDGQAEVLQMWNSAGRLGLIVYGWSGNAITMRWLTDNMKQGSGAVGWQLADLNGDGRAELIQLWDNGGKLGVIVYGWANNRMSTLWVTDNIGQGPGAVTWQVADINGDGRAELIQAWDNHGKLGVIVYGWKQQALKTLWSNADMKQGSGAIGWQVADVDGDGHPELVQLWDNHGHLGALVYGWDGHALKTRWATGNLGQPSAAVAWQCCDVNGDGRAELIQLQDHQGQLGMTVYGWSNGELCTLWTTDNIGQRSGARSWQHGDLEQNGRAELVQLRDNAGQLAISVYGWQNNAMSVLRTIEDAGEGSGAVQWLAGNIRGASTEILQLWDNHGQLGMILYAPT